MQNLFCIVIIGFAEFELTGHIDCFYVHHNWQRIKVGTSLIKEIKREALKRTVYQLFADVSVTAKPFFERQGFKVVDSKMVIYRGENFKQYEMLKSINKK